MKEEFKPIHWKNIKSTYFISNTGKVMNSLTGNILKPWINVSNGYYSYSLMANDNTVKKETLHVLVFIHFGDPKDVEIYKNSLGTYTYAINHKDGVKSNCNITNLELTTYKENYDHAVLHKLISVGEDLSYAKTTNEFVEHICELIESGKRNKEILKMLGFENNSYMKGLITRIRIGDAWKEISSKYNFEKKGSLRRNDLTTICNICKLIEYGHELKEMRYLLNVQPNDKDKFKKLVSGIRKRQIYRDISDNFTWWMEGSTTIEKNKNGYILFNRRSVYGQI